MASSTIEILSAAGNFLAPIAAILAAFLTAYLTKIWKIGEIPYGISQFSSSFKNVHMLTDFKTTIVCHYTVNPVNHQHVRPTDT
jgi:hypothetical protein